MEPFRDGNDVGHDPSKAQRLLLKFWRQALEEVKAAARGYDLVLHLGGDLVDGVGHHHSTQTLGDVNDQRALAVQLLLPYANMSKKIYALLGTDAHVGQSGAEDKSVAKELGAKSDWHWRLICGGRLLDWAHHTKMGRKLSTQENAPTALANDIRAECKEFDEQVPDMVVRHHVHRYVRTHTKGMDVVYCPGWQLQTSHTRSKSPAELLGVGIVLWYPKTGAIHPINFRVRADPIQTVKYD